jgi:uncharacterized Zn finger protein
MEKKTCDRCGKETEVLREWILDDEPNMMLCDSCWGFWEAEADYEYERQKEEGYFIDNPDHERDIKEDK